MIERLCSLLFGFGKGLDVWLVGVFDGEFESEEGEEDECGHGGNQH